MNYDGSPSTGPIYWSTALTRLEEISFVERHDDGRAKKPTVWYDDIEIDIRLIPRNAASDVL